MSGFKFEAPALASLPFQPLGAPTLAADLVEAEASYDGDPRLGPITFMFDATARGLIRVCNSVDDEDAEDGVLGAAAREESDEALSPALVFDAEHAWLKYRFGGSAEGSAAAEFKTPGGVSVRPKVEGRKGVVFAYYRQHNPAELVAAAVLADAPSLRVAFRAEDALALAEGDALLYRVYGELSAGLTLKWSDVFTASLSELSRLLDAGEVIALKADVGAEVNFRVGVRDDFRLVFTKGGPVGEFAETVRVSVYKSKTREVGVDAELGVTVEFANPEVVEAQLTKVYESLAGAAFKDLERILDEADRAASLEAIPTELQLPARLLMTRLGLDPVLNKPAELRAKWESIKSKVPGIIEKVAKTKVQLGFSYEYLRVSTDLALLRADLDAETFRRLHPDLMVCELKGLTEWLRDDAPEGALKRYLRRKTFKVSKAWGFNLGISPWGVKLGGTDRLLTTRVVQENVEGGQRVAYDGLRSYEGAWMKDKVTFAADFKAEMRGFAAPPLTCHFEYGLSLKWEWEEGTLNRDDLAKVLDHARLWRVVAPDHVAQAEEAAAGSLGKSATVRLELTLDQDALVGLLPLLVNPPAPPFNPPKDYAKFDADRRLETWGAEALAAAMPYMEMFDARRDPVVRLHLYAPLWRRYFEDDRLSFGDYRRIARQEIPRLADALKLNLKDENELAAHEAVEGQKPSTFAGMIELQKGPGGSSDGVHRNWRGFAQGLKSLESAARPDNCLPAKLVEQSFDDMSRFFTQSLYLRAVGYFVAQVAHLTGKSRLLKRSLTIDGGDGATIAIG
ncbi:MAG TPA: hypothetical protein VF297_19580 [Pyrinomonadaceae bacterium]